ncbi:hypothetical protein DL98DRAFT_594465 [Cadophora sp. DSE1049]|nr:hypothetical protein DL98DRAFT_594465 [Cadophora sp. DSE1049]
METPTYLPLDFPFDLPLDFPFDLPLDFSFDLPVDLPVLPWVIYDLDHIRDAKTIPTEDSYHSKSSSLDDLSVDLGQIRHLDTTQTSLPTNPASSKSRLGLNCTKRNLLLHLSMPEDVYRKIKLQSAQVSHEIQKQEHNIKPNHSDRLDDWGNFTERAKELAVALLLKKASSKTQPFLELAQPDSQCLNWICQWFLYHHCRHRRASKRALS